MQSISKKEQLQKDEGNIYLLTGPFGYGKTTFIRKLLLEPHNKKYAVIQNQFAKGQMGIQRPLIVDQSGIPVSNYMQLPNGCICCSAKNDLVAAVQYILTSTDIRNILVECNGAADPLQSIKQFWFDEEMKVGGQLHSVIAVVNAREWAKKKIQKDEIDILIEKGIRSANKIWISCADIISKESTDKIAIELRSMNPSCQIKMNTQTTPTQFLEGPSLFSVEQLTNLPEFPQTSHSHLTSIFIKCTLKSTLSQFQTLLGKLLWESHDLTILRIKGAVIFAGEEAVYEVQGIGQLFQIKKTQLNKQKIDGISRILFIGQHIKKDVLLKMLLIQDDKE